MLIPIVFDKDRQDFFVQHFRLPAFSSHMETACQVFSWLGKRNTAQRGGQRNCLPKKRKGIICLFQVQQKNRLVIQQDMQERSEFRMHPAELQAFIIVVSGFLRLSDLCTEKSELAAGLNIQRAIQARLISQITEKSTKMT